MYYNINIFIFIFILIILLINKIINNKSKLFENTLNNQPMSQQHGPLDHKLELFKNNKTLITYVYYEDENTIKNLDFFIKNGSIKNNEYTYLLIINNYQCSINIPDYYVVIKKENSYDLEAYNIIFNNEYINIKDYKYFIFINSSCIGPFIPVYCNNWVKCFTDLINDNIKLVGPIIEKNGNDLGYKAFINFDLNNNNNTLFSDRLPFIHSYMFATDYIGLELFKKYNIFEKVKSKEELIIIKEYLLTSCILYNNYNVKSLLFKYKNINWLNDKINFYSDPEIPNNYDGIDINPFEIIFVKNIRNSHEFRNENIAGISDYLKLYLTKYIEWS